MTRLVDISNLSVAITPDSFMAKFPGVKFRVGVNENTVTTFDPTSSEFLASFVPSQTREKTGGVECINPFVINDKYLSLGLRKALSHQINNFNMYGPKITSPAELRINNGYRDFYFGRSDFRINDFDSFIQRPSSEPSLGFDTLVDRLIRASITTEEVPWNKVRFRGYNFRSPTEGSLYRRLVNVYEHTPGKLYCLTFLNQFTYSSHQVDINSANKSCTISNIWFNKYSWDKGSGTEKQLVRGFYNGGMQFVLAKLLLGPLGFEIDFSGETFINFKVGEKNIKLPISPNSFSYSANYSLPSLSEHVLGSSTMNSFQLSSYSGQAVDYKVLGISYNPVSSKLEIPPSSIYSRLPPILKACVEGIVYYNKSVPPKYTLEEARKILIENVMRGETGQREAIEEEIRKVKMERTLGPNFVTDKSSQVGALDITNHIRTRSILDKLVFATS